MTSSPSRPAECRLLGCDWVFTAEQATLVGECRRRCGARAAHRFRRPEDAARIAGYLGHGVITRTERILRFVLRRPKS